MNHDDCARLASLAPSAALGALDLEDALFARAHLAACSRRHPALRDAFVLAAAVGGAMAPDVAPSASLRSRILAAARVSPGDPLR